MAVKGIAHDHGKARQRLGPYQTAAHQRHAMAQAGKASIFSGQVAGYGIGRPHGNGEFGRLPGQLGVIHPIHLYRPAARHGIVREEGRQGRRLIVGIVDRQAAAVFQGDLRSPFHRFPLDGQNVIAARKGDRPA